MRILISALSRFTSPTGICRHAANLAKCLSNQPAIDSISFAIGEWQRSYYGQLLGVRESEKLHFVVADVGNTSLKRNYWFFSGLPKLAQSEKADVLHVSFPIPLAQSDSYKTVASLHDLYPYDHPEVFGYPDVYFNRWFLRVCLRNADAISCVSETTKSRLERLFPDAAAKASVIPNSVAISDAAPCRPAGFTDDPFLLVVAQHRHNKNLGLAIHGFRQLLELGIIPSASKFVIVGSLGPETPTLKTELQKLQLERRTLLLSSITDEELQYLYRNCLLFLVTSTQEGFCLPLVEALLAGAKVVCSDIPVLREIADGACTYFSPDSQSLKNLVRASAKALRQVPASPNLKRFDPAAVGEVYVRLYDKVLGHKADTRTLVA